MSSIFSCLGKKGKSKKKKNGKPPEAKQVEDQPKDDGNTEHPIEEDIPEDKINGHVTSNEKENEEADQTQPVECTEETQQVTLIKELKSKLTEKTEMITKDNNDYVKLELNLSTADDKTKENKTESETVEIIENSAIKSVEAEIEKIEAISKDVVRPQLSKSESITETVLKQTNVQLSEQNQNLRRVCEENEKQISRQKEEIKSLKNECKALKSSLSDQTKLQDVIKERNEIMVTIDDLNDVCSLLKLRLDKAENEKYEKFKSASEVESKLTSIDSDHHEIDVSVKNVLKSFQELECRIITLELDKENDKENEDDILSNFQELENLKSNYEEELTTAVNRSTELQNRINSLENQNGGLSLEVSRLQTENKEYKEQLEENLNSSRVKDEKVSSMKNVESGLQNTVRNLESKLDHFEARHKSDAEEIAVLKTKLEKLENQLREKEIAHQETIKKLSEAQNKQEDLQKRINTTPADKTTAVVPMILSTDSPEKIGEKFRGLYSTVWCEAYHKLHTVCKRDERKTLLILMEYITECYLYSRRTARHQMDALLSLLTSPTNMRGSLNKRLQRTGQIDSIPTVVKQSIMAFRRTPSDNFIESIFEEFMNQVDYQKSRHLRSIQARDITEVTPFVRKCIGVCWEMVTQEPPMYLLFKLRHNQIIDRDKFDVYSGDGNKVDFLVWPALLVDENGPLLQKGVVQAVRS